jgi:hypothetical protein
MTKNISGHVTAFLSGVLSLVAIVHPGFHISGAVQATIGTIGAVIAAALELTHLVGKQALERRLTSTTHAVNQLVSQLGSVQPTPPAAPETAPVTPQA